MAGIERLAAALFNEQRKLVTDETLRRIFETFVVDEIRHSQAAEMLAEHYDVHAYKKYEMNPDLERFTPHFVNAVRHLSAEIANVYITCGELILDVALLRSLNDFVNDGMSQQAMNLINRDESRHIAIDFHMCEYYASSPEYAARQKAMPKRSARARAKSWWAFANVLYHAGPFFRSVFFEPMDLTDPSGRRIKEAFKRIQLIATRPGATGSPFVGFMETMRRGYNIAPIRIVLGRAIARITGVDPRVLETLYTRPEVERARRMTWDELAQDALAAKYQ
jgi:rubrerythrin